MSFFVGLELLGGLALFLYGMNAMKEGLVGLSGDRLKQILARLTSNRWMGVLTGAGITAILQSSSAVTVMVVGLVNSGTMQLSQTVGVIMGANIGTTVTSWILGLTGLEGDSFLVQICKPSSFSPIFAFVGVLLLLTSSKEKRKEAGAVLAGFAILMYGMEMMSEAVRPLSEMPEFMRILIQFRNPVYGMAAGTILTAVIQSSSASVGMLQALCMTGAVDYGTALPIIMGQNIGTCVTALLSGIGACKNAVRAALIHLYFNIIGTVLFTGLFYGLNIIYSFSFLESATDAFGIAVIHSVFNVLSTIVLLPFGKQLEKLTYITTCKWSI